MRRRQKNDELIKSGNDKKSMKSVRKVRENVMGRICGKVSSVPGVKERRSDRKSGDKGEDESVCVCVKR